MPPKKPSPQGDARLWADARDAVDRLELIHAVWRWAGLTGRVPRPDDWKTDRGWPSSQEAEDVFGSWNVMIEESAIAGAPVLELAEREEELGRRAASVEKDAAKLPELRRLADAAKDKREAAESARQEAQGERDRVIRERDALTARVAELEAALETARAAQPAPPPPPVAPAGPSPEHEQQLHDLQDQLEQALADREQDRRAIDELTRLLAAVDAQPVATAPVQAETPPATVLEAVERAAAGAAHLRFAPRAFETAADSPFRRPGLVLRTLRALDDLAGRFAAGEMGASLSQAASEHGITQWKGDVAETTRKRYENDYVVTWEGHRLPLGPHIGLGSGSGAQFIARVYLHVSDGGAVPRGITVGSVGRHLPDTTV